MKQSNYPDTVISAFAMTTSFWIDFGPIVNGNGGDKNTSNTNTIVSIHSTDYSNNCSKHNDDESIKLFESIANNGRTNDYEDVLVTSELENDNISDNFITRDDDDGDNDTESMSGNDNDDDSSQEDSVSANNNTNSITNSADATPSWILLVLMADDDDDDPDNYNDF